mgnify:CR=1 FL=1
MKRFIIIAMLTAIMPLAAMAQHEEDTENGVQAAKNAGIDVIVVSDKEKRKFADCPIIIQDYSDKRLYELF